MVSDGSASLRLLHELKLVAIPNTSYAPQLRAEHPTFASSRTPISTDPAAGNGKQIFMRSSNSSRVCLLFVILRPRDGMTAKYPRHVAPPGIS